MEFDAFVADIQNQNRNVFGVEVYEAGKLTHWYGDTQEQRHPIYSATKTITSIGVGMAVDEGKLELERSVLAYMPQAVMAGLSAEQQKTFQAITVERLLTMSVGELPFAPEGESWLKYTLSIPMKHAEKRAFQYSNLAAYLAGVAASCALGEDLYEYLNRKLFLLLEIETPPYERCPDGYFYGASKMELTVRELSKIGLLLAQGGMWKGQQLVSEDYVKAATALQQPNCEGGYGYLIWKYRDGFSINGKWGQKCYVLPKEKKLITFLSHMEEKEACEKMKKSMERTLLDRECHLGMNLETYRSTIEA